MSRLGINTGSTPNDGTGDTLLAGAVKINSNFQEVYNVLGDGTNAYVGIVTQMVAGSNISISTSFGSVTVAVTGLSTSNIRADSLVVSGVSTLGVVTGATYYGDGSNLTGIAVTANVSTNTLVVSGVSTLGVVTGATYFGDGSNLTGVSTANIRTDSLVVTGVSTLGIVTGATYYGDGSNLTGVVTTLTGADGSGLTGITTLISAGDNITVTTNAGITTIASSAGSGSTAEVRANTLVVSGVSTVGILTASQILVTGISSISDHLFIGAGRTAQTGVAGTDWDSVTLSGLSPSSFNQTYQTQTTGFVLDTGTVSSGNALFHADSNYYYYVATTGTDPEDRMLIWSVEDSSWMTVFDLGDPDYREGNVSNNQAVGSVFSASVTANSANTSGRNTPVASSDIVYGSTTGITTTGIGVTIRAGGNAEFAGIVTATSFTGSGVNLTGITTLIQAGNSISVTTNAGITTITSTAIASTADVRANTLVVTGVSTLGVVTGATYYGDASYTVSGRWTLGADGTNNYTFTGIGFTVTTNDPILYLARGRVYEFINNMGAHPFEIRVSNGGAAYNTGVTNNGAVSGIIRFEIPFDAPETLYYQCTSHAGMGNTISVYPSLI